MIHGIETRCDRQSFRRRRAEIARTVTGTGAFEMASWRVRSPRLVLPDLPTQVGCARGLAERGDAESRRRSRRVVVRTGVA